MSQANGFLLTINGTKKAKGLVIMLITLVVAVMLWVVYSLEKQKDDLLSMQVLSACVNNDSWHKLRSGSSINEELYSSIWTKCRSKSKRN